MKLSAYLSETNTPVLRLAKRAGVAHSTILRLLGGRISRRETLAKIAAATDGRVSETDLLIEAHAANWPTQTEAA